MVLVTVITEDEFCVRQKLVASMEEAAKFVNQFPAFYTWFTNRINTNDNSILSESGTLIKI